MATGTTSRPAQGSDKELDALEQKKRALQKSLTPEDRDVKKRRLEQEVEALQIALLFERQSSSRCSVYLVLLEHTQKPRLEG